MSIYANGLNIDINEVAILTFMESNQAGSIPVSQIAVTYEALKQFYAGIGFVIEQHEARLNQAFSNRAKSN